MPSRPTDTGVSRPRKRDQLSSLFKSTSRKRDSNLENLSATGPPEGSEFSSRPLPASNPGPRDGGRDQEHVEGDVDESSSTGLEDVDESKDLWARAFRSLKSRDPSMVEQFEKQLVLIAQPESPSGHVKLDFALIEAVVKQKLDKNEAERLVVHVGKMAIKIRAAGENIIKTILWANTFIGASLSSQPYASLAWSGISVLLPLLLNSSKQNQRMVVGLESITQLMQLFRIREELYLLNTESAAPSDFVTSLMDLYSAILEFQVRAINHLSQTAIRRGITATFELDNWESLLSNVHSANEQCSKFTTLFDKEREMKQMSLIKQSTKIQSEMRTMFQTFQDQRQRDRQDDKETALLQALASDYRSDKDFVSKRIEDTCEWFFQDEKFASWRDAKTSSLLWVSAGPGCGKSVLSRALIDESRLSRAVMTSTVCYFFFKDGQQQRMHSANALSAILHQLFTNPNLISHGLSSHRKHGGALSANFSELWDILIETAKDPDAGDIICVIDALDECDECDEKRCRRQFIDKLIDFFEHANPDDTSSVCIKFLITSRPYEDLETQFTRLPSNSSYVRFDGDERTEQIGREINLVIDVKVKEFASSLIEDHQRRIAKRLKEMNNRTYLWLFLTIDIIERSPRSKYGKLSNIESLLSNLPTEVSQAYETILDRTPNRRSARIFLQMIVAAARPLTLIESNVALTLATQDGECFSHDTLDLWPQEEFGSVVKNTCGLLVSVHDGKISLLHQTVREFLMCTSSTGTTHTIGKWGGSIEIHDAHRLWSRICLKYLTFSDFATEDLALSVATDRSEFVGLGYLEPSVCKRYPLLDYTAFEWAMHYRYQADESTQHFQTLAGRLCDPSRMYVYYWVYMRRGKISYHNPPLSDPFYQWCYPFRRNPVLWPRLVIAAGLGLTDVVRRFLEEGDAPNIGDLEDAYTPTPLYIASYIGYVEIVRALLLAGADPGWQSPFRLSSFDMAAELGNTDILKLFFDAGIDGGLEGRYATHVLLRAVRRGKLRTVVLFAENGAPLGARDGDDHDALAIACKSGWTEIVKYLIEHGADVHASGPQEGPAIYAACRGGKKEIIDLLVSKDANVHAQGDSRYTTTLQAACKYGNSETVKYLIDKGVDVNAPAGRYGTALHIACSHFFYDKTQAATVELLIKNGADVNVSDESNCTPLQLICKHMWFEPDDKLQSVRLLIEHGADVNARKSQTRSPLALALNNKDMMVAEVLQDHGATLDDSEKQWLAEGRNTSS